MQEWLMCSGDTLTNGNSVRKIPTRILFLPLHDPGSIVRCLCISLRKGIPGLGLTSMGLHFIFSFTSQNQKQHEGSCYCHFLGGFWRGSMTWTSECTTRTYTTPQTPFCAWAVTFYLSLKAILNWASSSLVKIKGSQSAYDGEAQGRETFAP